MFASTGVTETLLVVAAHPDDEVLGCGGTIAKFRSEGKRVVALILAQGITSRDVGNREAREQLERLKSSAEAAHGILGSELLTLGNLPDNKMDSVPLLEVIKQIESVIQDIQPSVVLTHGPWDVNVDHTQTHKAVLSAVRSLPHCPVRFVAFFPVVSSTEWLADPHNLFAPTLFVDVTSVVDAKIEALQAYGSEMREAPHPRSLKSVKAQMTIWGSTAGTTYAEAFQIGRVLL